MRIAVFNPTNRVVGGVERYLAASLNRLGAMGHEVRLYCEEVEEAAGSDRETLPVPATLLQPPDTLRKSPAAVFEGWKPEVVCVHGQLDPAIEEAAMGIGVQTSAPPVYFAHAFAGACISGGKTLHDPQPRPCHRALGPLCLAHYYPHRCGGLDPRTMIRGYSRNRAQLARLHKYKAIVIFSSYMKAEYVRNGIDASLLKLIPPFSPEAAGTDGVPAGPELSVSGVNGAPTQIGFLGRFEPDKGVGMLIRALPLVARQLDRNIVATLCGDGRRYDELRALAASVASANPRVRFDFQGWISREKVQELFASIHLLVVPSVWPEPFGLVGLEAAQHGVPTAAFAVGGITDWLIEGLNGHVANGARPTFEGLAQAIVACLRDPAHHAELRRGAIEVSARFSPEAHMRSLEQMLGDLAMSPA